jgi:hypothetical protein
MVDRSEPRLSVDTPAEAGRTMKDPRTATIEKTINFLIIFMVDCGKNKL